MRSLILFLLALPVIAGAQINRSAKELASEKIGEYVVNKLFKNQQYKSVSYGDIKPYGDKKSPIAWSIVHKFEIKEANDNAGKTANAAASYTSLFYLDEKMKVLRVETSSSY
ncbi:MAG: hypothetical protein WDO16_19250 [Bacteroidota bacterium]